MVRIDAISIQKLGNVAGATKLHFGPRGVVLLGRNGTGKTTLLNLLVSLCRGNWDSLHDSDYDVAFDLTFNGGTQFHISLGMHTEQDSEAPSESEQFERLSSRPKRRKHHQANIQIRYPNGESTDISSTNRKTTYKFSDGKTKEKNLSPEDGWALLDEIIPNSFSEEDFPWMSEIFVLSNQITRFDEGLGYFSLLTEESDNGFQLVASFKTNKPNFNLHVSASRFIDMNLAKLLLSDFSTSTYHYGRGDSQSIEYLQRFCHLAGFEHASINLDLDERIKDESGERITLGPIRYAVTTGGTEMHHRHLSFGERRLLAFLHYLNNTKGPIIADELVNGMHYDWIIACLQMLEHRQAFLSSQNPLLFDFLEFDSVEDVASRFVICKHDDKRGFVWSNMSHDDALELYETYKTGIQHVGEILRTRGYW